MPLDEPTYDIVPPGEAEKRRPNRRARKQWGPVVDALAAGRTLFFPAEQLNEYNVKYLMLCFYRRGRGEHLSTSLTFRHGVEGRLLWVREAAE